MENDTLKAEYITHMGDDLMVVNCARVSFDKYKTEFDESDEKLIRYLAKHDHWSPFSHPQIQLRITVPVAIGAQLKRHVVGFSLNEVSRRYVDSSPTFYYPDKWRGRPPGSIKQGSSEEIIEKFEGSEEYITNAVSGFYRQALKLYHLMTIAGIAPEMCRFILPQAMLTSWIWTGSLYAWARLCKQRLDSHAQQESQIIARQISDVIRGLFPVSWAILLEVNT